MLHGSCSWSWHGKVGPYFHNKRGLRQGDSFSPILFNFVVDTLSAIFDKAKAAGHLKGVVCHLIPGGVSQLQYADNTMLLFEPDTHSITTIKLILLAFEAMSGMKINFHKCEVIPMGLVEANG